MTKDEISDRLTALGVEHDGRWAKDRLEALLLEHEPKEEPDEATVPIRLLTGYWPKGSSESMLDKLAAGTEANLPVSEARRLIAEGKAERADPFPGD